ncbi:MAG: nucleoid-structuring protein H-NS [Mycobacterium sp.]
MADPQEPSDKRPEAAPETLGHSSAPDPSAPKAAAENAPAKKAPAKKAPARKAPAKKAPAKAVKKAPAKKAPAKKAPEKKPPPPAAVEPVVIEPAVPAADLPAPVASVSDGAKEAAAQAKSAVEQASDGVAAPLARPVEQGRSPLPLVVAIAVSLLALLVIRQLRRSSDDS